MNNYPVIYRDFFISHSKDPYEPIRISWNVMSGLGEQTAHLLSLLEGRDGKDERMNKMIKWQDISYKVYFADKIRVEIECLVNVG